MDDVSNLFFVNNCIGSFYSGVLNWVGTGLYPRFKYRVLGTYEKSVEYFNKKLQLGKEVDTNILPSVTLDPTYDFEPSPQGGRFLWQYPNLSPGLGKYLFTEIEGLKDQDVTVTPVFTRYTGTFDLICWLHSVYELLDTRVMFYQYSGGRDRWMRPEFFQSFIILPDMVRNHKVGDSPVPINWDRTLATTRMVDNLGHERFTYPVLLTPMFRITNITDASTKYGGDSIAQYKLSVAIEYEVNLPTFILITDFIGGTIKLDMEIGATYSNYGKSPTIDPTTGNIIRDTVNVIPDDKLVGLEPPGVTTKSFKERVIYTFTGTDVTDAEGYFYIDNPFTLGSKDVVAIVSYPGLLEPGAVWTLVSTTNKFKIKIEPRENEIVEMYRYIPGD